MGVHIGCMKTIAMLLLFGSFMITGNPWAAIAVILLGVLPEEKAAPKPPVAKPVKAGFIMRWLDAQSARNVEATEREINFQKGNPSFAYVSPQEIFEYRDKQSRLWGIKIW